MTTRATFDFRDPGEFGAGATLDDVRDLLSGSELPSLLMPGSIGPQTAMQGSGIPIDRVRRGLLGPLLGGASNYTVSATSFAELDSALLAGVMVCTGRPVLLMVSAGVLPTNVCWLSVSMDGTEVTTRGGMVYTQLATTGLYISGWAMVVPRPGPRRFAMIGRVNAGSATVYSDFSGNLTQMVAVEL